MKIAVGSQNPVKIEGVKQAFQKVFGDCEVVGVSVSSGISNMPMNFEDLVKGAKNRAERAIKRLNADFGVGLEGGFEKTELGTFLTGLVAVVDKKGRWGFGKGSAVLMPEEIVKRVRKGKELGDVMDEIRGLKNTKQHDGAVGFFTKNLVPRAKNLKKEFLDYYEKKELHKKVLLYNKKYPKTRIEVACNICTAGRNRCAIQPDGFLTPCPATPNLVTVENIKELSFLQIWNDSKLFKKIRKSKLKKEGALDLEYKRKNVCILHIL